MINCWTVGKKVVRSAHRAVHRIVHRARHYYHSPAVKIIAPAIVCVTTGAGIAPWLTPIASPKGLAPPSQSQTSIPLAASAIPVGGGAFISGASDLSFPEITLPPNVGEIPVELMTIWAQDSTWPPSAGPSNTSQSVPEPSTALLLSTTLGLLLVARGAARSSAPKLRICVEAASSLVGDPQPRSLRLKPPFKGR